MAVRAVVWRSFYQDSVVLMRVAADLRGLPGVREAAALMGTPANHELLASAGLTTPETKAATPADLVLAVEAATDAEAEAACAAARAALDERRRARESSGKVLPRTLDSALRQLPDANLAAISVPGAYATLEALTALRRGLHVFLFSDNVALADEVELKRLALDRRLLCMGPDCGTAYLNGTGLGFANVVPRGRVGCVAASGTGLQAVASRLAALGEGISHGIGVGGRDLSAEVGGAMTFFALETLAGDPSTAAVVVISKPPAASMLPRLEAAIGAIGKPVIVCALGARAGATGTWVATLEDAAEAAVAVLHARAWTPRVFGDPAAIRSRLAAVTAAGRPRGTLMGLFTGGTLAQEARLLLEPLLGPIAANFGEPATGRHRILDLGADEFTRSRPHPMLDPSARDARVREAGAAADVGVLLVDLVLGRGAHPDPARSLAAAIGEARRTAERAGRTLVAIASVVGTEADPQGLAGQIASLREAAVEVLPSSAQAARFAALVQEPGLTSRLLGP
jgi:FdrA protein